MLKKTAIVLLVFVFAFTILFVSVFRTASVKYEFNPLVSGTYNSNAGIESVFVDYYLPYPGDILPGSFLWPVKAARDSFWLFINTNPSREAELMLLFADKRIGSAEVLFKQGNFDDGFSALTKAEKYLESASKQEEINRSRGLDTSEFLVKISKAALKHFEVIDRIVVISPDEAKPIIMKTENYSKKVFETSRNALLDKGMIPPENPFSWE